MDQTRFQALANATLDHCYDQLEPFYDDGIIEDLDLQDGVLTIVTETGKTFILNKHGPSQQLWLATPDNGLHFSFDDDSRAWKLPDGTLLYDLLRRDLAAQNIAVIL